MKTRHILMSPLKATVGVGAVLFLLAATSPVSAIKITGVDAPNLVRPSDGFNYLFDITVSGTYDALDIAAGAPITVNVEYWDEDLFPFGLTDDPIDTTGILTVPAALPQMNPGAGWGPIGLTTSLAVGCDIEGLVIGIGGNETGENPMNDGYFHFTSGAGLTIFDHGTFGYNTVTCGPPGPAFNPVRPYPAMTLVPEPSSVGLAFAGVLGLLTVRRRPRQH